MLIPGNGFQPENRVFLTLLTKPDALVFAREPKPVPALPTPADALEGANPQGGFVTAILSLITHCMSTEN